MERDIFLKNYGKSRLYFVHLFWPNIVYVAGKQSMSFSSLFNVFKDEGRKAG